MNTKVLLTGFEPFAGSSLNPSQEIVNEIAKINIPGIEIITAILPVLFGKSSEKLLESIAAAPSLSAGTFVCNHIFYSLQHALFNTNIKSGFIHVPLMTEQSGEFPNLFTMPLSEMVKGITAAITVACSK